MSIRFSFGLITNNQALNEAAVVHPCAPKRQIPRIEPEDHGAKLAAVQFQWLFQEGSHPLFEAENLRGIGLDRTHNSPHHVAGAFATLMSELPAGRSEVEEEKSARVTATVRGPQSNHASPASLH